MTSSARSHRRSSRRLPTSWMILVAALVLLGTVTLLQWALNLLGAFIRVSLVVVIAVVLVSWVHSAVTRR